MCLSLIHIYIIQHGKNGFLFEAKDVNSLKSVLDGLKNHNDIQMIRYNGCLLYTSSNKSCFISHATTG